MKKCKVCKAEFRQVYSTTQSTCSVTCAVILANQKKQKDWEKRKRSVKEELRTIQDYIKLAQQVFNKYIRLRDQGQPCIACGSKEMKKVNASHFYSAGGHYAVRFDERNVHSGCEHCNTFLSGNLLKYRENLLAKLGYEEFERLSFDAMKTRNYTKEELKEIIDTYKNKIKELTLNK